MLVFCGPAMSGKLPQAESIKGGSWDSSACLMKRAEQWRVALQVCTGTLILGQIATKLG